MDFEELVFQNPHWMGEKYAVPEFKRGLFQTLWENLGHRLILSITGLRRVGKTIIMRQMINKLIESGTHQNEILYFSFDTSSTDMRELITEWSRRFSLDFRNKKVYVFFDEIQKIDNWGE